MTETELIVLDVRGQICPSTLLSALRKINELQEGLKEGHLTLEIKTDNRDATNTIPNAAANMGLAAFVEKCENYYSIVIKGAA